MTDWQPIETAPKDGSVILLFRTKKQTRTIYPARWAEALDPSYPWQVLCAYHGDNFLLDDCHMTHWMSLPEPPEGDTM